MRDSLGEEYLARLNRALLRLGCKYSADSGEDISIALAAAFEAIADRLEALEEASLHPLVSVDSSWKGPTDA